MNQLQARWRQVNERVIQLSMRERMLLLGVGLLLIGWLFGHFWLQPVQRRIQGDQQRLASVQRDIDIAHLEVEGRQQRLLRDPDSDVRDQLKAVESQLQRFDSRLKAQTVDLIAAEEMPNALHALLAQGKRLTMVDMKSMAPVALLPEQQGVNLYRHEIRMQLVGGYFDVYQYLRGLEQLPRHFYWHQFDYQVDEWPHAKVSLSVYTLSSSKEFIRG